MIDAKDVHQSKEMMDVVRAIGALRRKFGFQTQEQDHPWPVALALVGKYRADKVLKILTDETSYYPGYKEVLAASFGGWLIAPRSPRLREALMIQAALAHMNDAATRASVRTSTRSDLTIEEDIAARYLYTGTDFLVEIYDCLGGYAAFSEAPSFDELWDAIGTVEKTINTTVRAIAFLHLAVDEFGRPGFDFIPSLNKAVTVLDELKEDKRGFPYKEKYVSRSLLHERWSQNKQTLALIYAASTIRINRKTLLQIILDGFFSFDSHSRHLADWLGRARYVSAHIFAQMADNDLARQTDGLLGEGKANKFSPPKLLSIERECFDHSFRNYIKR